MVVSLLLDRCWEVLEFISLFRTPTSVCHILEACRSRFFFWGDIGRPEEDSLVKCDPLLNSKEKYGLDVGSLDAFNFGSFV